MCGPLLSRSSVRIRRMAPFANKPSANTANKEGLARSELANLFRNTTYWGPHSTREQMDASYSRTDFMGMLPATRRVLELLAAFPVLASEEFWHDEVVTGGQRERRVYYPLSFFLWNNFDSNVLSKILSYCPQVLHERQGGGDNFLEFVCETDMYTDETLI